MTAVSIRSAIDPWGPADMYALRILIATSDPYHLLMAGYALGSVAMFGGLTLFRRWRHG